uniref:Uncharacterized protein n=1 Tax=Cacopsylla melanoneura TaxID=428564 RepID=A0A8D8Q720_9HEMI
MNGVLFLQRVAAWLGMMVSFYVYWSRGVVWHFVMHFIVCHNSTDMYLRYGTICTSSITPFIQSLTTISLFLTTLASSLILIAHIFRFLQHNAQLVKLNFCIQFGFVNFSFDFFAFSVFLCVFFIRAILIIVIFIIIYFIFILFGIFSLLLRVLPFP